MGREAPQKYNFVSTLNEERLVDSFMAPSTKSLWINVLQKTAMNLLWRHLRHTNFSMGGTFLSGENCYGPHPHKMCCGSEKTTSPSMGLLLLRSSWVLSRHVLVILDIARRGCLIAANYYMNEKSTCFLNYVDPAKSESLGRTSEMTIYNRQDVAFVPGSKAVEPNDAVTLHKWRGQTPFPDNPHWGAFGLMYAELVQTSEGLNNIVLVQSGMQTKPKAIMEGLVDWMESTAGIGGRNSKDPRIVVELEDRDGADVCMWLYHICCAMGGVLKRIPEEQDQKHGRHMLIRNCMLSSDRGYGKKCPVGC